MAKTKTVKKINLPKYLKEKKEFLLDQIQIHISKRVDCRNINYLLAQVHLVEEMEKKL